ncbi:MAG: ribonuclease E/G [Alphaproteobacteria bacterium]
MPKQILIDAVYSDETRVVIYENNLIQEFDYETASKKQIKGYIYLAKVTRVEPGLQAAFVEYGPGKHGFLPFSEIHPDYFQIPVSDRQKLKESFGIYENKNLFETLPNDGSLPIPALTPPDITEEDEHEELHKNHKLNDSQAQKNIENLHNLDDFLPEDLKTDMIAEDSHPIEMEETFADPIEENLSEEESYESYPPRANIYKHYKIHEVIKRNQIILVQAIKEERGNKGASFTSYISLAGRYCVLMPNSDRQGGISRRITDIDDRKRIKEIIDGLNLAGGTSVIVRTAGANRSKAEIKRDYDYLVKLWNSIRDFTLNSNAPAFIHAESDIIKRTIRDLYDDHVSEILIQGDKAYRLAKDFMKKIIPNYVHKIKQYKSKVPIFCRYQIEEQLASLYSPMAYLQSGGYIVINQTEALISIDVNSGKSTSERNVEETAFKTNFEAAREIARQIRLRDLPGLIVIDFIDMEEIRNKRLIEKSMKDFLQADRAKIQVGMISEFGLLEMSRQRLGSSFIESNTVSCNHCNGKGIIRASESNSVMILRTIESEIYKGDYETVNIYACFEAIIYILNNKRSDITSIEEKYNTKLIFHSDPQATGDGFSIERIKRAPANSKVNLVPSVSLEMDYEEEAPVAIQKRNWKTKQSKEAIPAPAEEAAIIENPETGEISSKRKKLLEKRAAKRKIKKKALESKKLDTLAESQPDNIEVEENSNVEIEKNIVRKRKPLKHNYKKKKLNETQKDNVAKAEPESIFKGFWKRIIE